MTVATELATNITAVGAYNFGYKQRRNEKQAFNEAQQLAKHTGKQTVTGKTCTLGRHGYANKQMYALVTSHATPIYTCINSCTHIQTHRHTKIAACTCAHIHNQHTCALTQRTLTHTHIHSTHSHIRTATQSCKHTHNSRTKSAFS